MQIQASTTYNDCKVGSFETETGFKSEFLPKSIVNIDTPFPTKQVAILRRTRNKPKLILPYGSSLFIEIRLVHKNLCLLNEFCKRWFDRSKYCEQFVVMFGPKMKTNCIFFFRNSNKF